MDNSTKMGTFKPFSMPVAVKVDIIGAQEDSDHNQKTAAIIQNCLVS